MGLRGFYCLFLTALLLVPAAAADAKKLQTFEQEAVENAIIHCILPVRDRKNIEVEAAKHIVAVDNERARKIDPTAGKVFTILSNRGETYLAARLTGACRIFVRRVQVMDFWTEIEGAFGARSPFIYSKTTDMVDGMVKTYKVNFDGPAELQVYVRDAPTPDQFQVMINFFRTDGQEE